MEPQVRSSNYDVFINFRGEDTRDIFVGHLYKALKGRGIRAFLDSKDLQKGEDIGKLLTIIEGVKLSISVFSQRYVESKWCLRELAQMLECHRDNDQIDFPIFFKVKPSEVKDQTGCFGILPQRHGKETQKTIAKWKEALRAAGNMSGWVVDDRDDQAKLVEKVVQRAWILLNINTLIDVKHPVELESRLKDVLSHLSNTANIGSMDVMFLGICGQGGIGKTTIAMIVYNCISKNFAKSCFLENITENASQSNGLVHLQEKLLYGISHVKTEILSSKEGSELIKRTLQNEKTLLLLDDVGDRDQLNALARDLNWFGSGSRIIITTRDQKVLSGVPNNNRKIYEPPELNEQASLRLFSLYAFLKDQLPNDYMQLSVDIVCTTGGLPLALEVLGAELAMTKEKKVWKSTLCKIKQIPHDGVYGRLKISYDSLNDIEKTIFLDVACFFLGWEEEEVISILETCVFEPTCHVATLKRKSLLKIHDSHGIKKLWMHDQIRDMGRRIAYNQRPENPNNHSRLWSWDNVMKVLKSDKGKEMVEGLQLNSNECRDKNTCLCTKSFENMPNLRLLQIDGTTLEGSFQCLPSGLRWLRWKECPLEKLLADFHHEGLIILDLQWGKFRQAWNNKHENKLFQYLKVLQLSHCEYLSESPNFSGFPHLERLCLDYCTKLVNLDESIGELQQLVDLDLSNCFSLKKLPDSICRLRSLQNLILYGCFKIEELPVSIGDLKESLVELSLDYARIKALPDGVGLLKKLEVLNLRLNWQLMYLPSSMENMTSLRKFDLDGYHSVSCIPKLPSSLIEFHGFGNQFESSQDMLNMKNLGVLHLRYDMGMTKQFRGFVKTRNDDDDEFSEVIRDSKVLTNHHRRRWWQTQGQQETTFVWGNIESWREIWIPLQLRGKHNTFHCLIPDIDDIGSCRRLIFHVPSIADDEFSLIDLNIRSCVRGKDKKTDITQSIAIWMRNRVQRANTEFIYEFEGLDWFRVQLEGGDTIEIISVDLCFKWYEKPRGVKVFLVKEVPMFDNHQFSNTTECHYYGNRFLEIVRYQTTEEEEEEEADDDDDDDDQMTEEEEEDERKKRWRMR